jgi:hypothetical protein
MYTHLFQHHSSTFSWNNNAVYLSVSLSLHTIHTTIHCCVKTQTIIINTHARKERLDLNLHQYNFTQTYLFTPEHIYISVLFTKRTIEYTLYMYTVYFSSKPDELSMNTSAWTHETWCKTSRFHETWCKISSCMQLHEYIEIWKFCVCTFKFFTAYHIKICKFDRVVPLPSHLLTIAKGHHFPVLLAACLFLVRNDATWHGTVDRD